MKAGMDPHIGAEMVTRLPAFLAGRQRILFWGEMGSGKSTLAIRLLSELNTAGDSCRLLSLDPGSPRGGVPGTVCRAWLADDTLRWGDIEAVCSFDAVRFRLPLIQAAGRLMKRAGRAMETVTTLFDPPGVTRGVGGAELLIALVESLHIDGIVAVHQRDEKPPLVEELASLSVEIISVEPHSAARSPGKIERAKHRTVLWNSFLENADEISLEPCRLQILGTPPPLAAPHAWVGRQVAQLSRSGATLMLGEVIAFDGGRLTVRAVHQGEEGEESAALLLRDGGRGADGMMGTIPVARFAAPINQEPGEMGTPEILQAPANHSISSHVGPAWATLLGGVFADPLLHVRLRHHKTSLLFDLGGSVRPTTKIAHQVNSVFLSHFHLDHIGGFLWFLRARIGDFPPCAIFGPPKTISRLENFIEAVAWDRIEESGPVFDVHEIGAARLRRARLQPGKQTVFLPDHRIEEAVISAAKEYSVEACVLDHRIPSIAYALIFDKVVKVRKSRLESYGFTPGPWLGRLKKAVGEGAVTTEIELPDGTWRKAGALASELLITQPGHKLVYATDFADTPENRRKIIKLASGAHTMFCEAAFSGADEDKARATQHLTTRAAVEIGKSARVGCLVPFHFSKRYERNPDKLYDEIRSMAGEMNA